ncbi:peroxidasin-like isoform X2 [Montipora foliosa]|uniref:peroxidasin-like isoform X2 n=1 Tax=Montipora foliosa TaxID=591990 RepID=UPI0035F115BD
MCLSEMAAAKLILYLAIFLTGNEKARDERNATKLFVTLNIRNVTLADDSNLGILGRYECHAFAVNDSVARKHGFTVIVIPVANLPKISVSANRTVKHNSRVEIACNLTEGEEATTSLKRISWYKNGELFESVRSPDPDKTEDTLKPLNLQSVGVRDAGVYTCLLEVVLRQTKNYNISKSMELRIAPWLTPPNEDIEVKSFKDETAQFNCSAKGNPLEVEWKVQTKGKDEVQACIHGSNGKYEVKRNGPFDPYFLLVKNLQYTDRGFYYCCLPTNCSDSVDGCQRFILRVRVAPWLTPPKKDVEVKRFEYDTAQFICAAKGNPLEVEWKVQKIGQDEVQACINGSDKKYGIRQSGIGKPYILTVSDLKYSDAGYYYCCLSPSCSSSHSNRENCQRFTLVVSGTSSTRQICDTCMLVMLFLSKTLISARNML